LENSKLIARRLPDQRGIQVYLGLIGFSVVGLVFTRLTSFDPGWISPISAAAVLLVGAGLVARAIGWVAAAVIAVLGGVSELVGLFTGFPFGHYVYSQVWWPTISLGSGGHFPLLVPIAWVMVVGASYAFVGVRCRTPFLRIAASATLATMIDAGMEPVITHQLGYWHWVDLGRPFGALPGGSSPILNSMGWWLVSAIAVAVIERLAKARAKASLAAGIVLGAYIALMVMIGGGEPLQPLLVGIVFVLGCMIALDLPPKKPKPKDA
jgi:uncharacterized membrane protein